MSSRACELFLSFLERNQSTELPAPVERALLRIMSTYRDARELIRELAQSSPQHAYHALRLTESSMPERMVERLRREIHLIEEEREAAILAAAADDATLKAHLALFSLLPPGAEGTERRRRVLALVLEKRDPLRAAPFVGEVNPALDLTGFWKALRRRLMSRVRSLSLEATIPLIDSPKEAQLLLLELAFKPGTTKESLVVLITRKMGPVPFIDYSLLEIERLIDTLLQRRLPQVIDVLLMLSQSNFHSVPERAAILLLLMRMVKDLPEEERGRLVNSILKVGISYLPEADRRVVLKHMAHLTPRYSLDTRQQIRLRRAMALLIHLSPERLQKAQIWAHTYDTRFHKRLEAVQKERGKLLLYATALLKRRETHAL